MGAHHKLTTTQVYQQIFRVALTQKLTTCNYRWPITITHLLLAYYWPITGSDPITEWLTTYWLSQIAQHHMY